MLNSLRIYPQFTSFPNPASSGSFVAFPREILVGWVQPTECSGLGSVGCTHRPCSQSRIVSSPISLGSFVAFPRLSPSETPPEWQRRVRSSRFPRSNSRVYRHSGRLGFVLSLLYKAQPDAARHDRPEMTHPLPLSRMHAIGADSIHPLIIARNLMGVVLRILIVVVPLPPCVANRRSCVRARSSRARSAGLSIDRIVKERGSRHPLLYRMYAICNFMTKIFARPPRFRTKSFRRLDIKFSAAAHFLRRSERLRAFPKGRSGAVPAAMPCGKKPHPVSWRVAPRSCTIPVRPPGAGRVEIGRADRRPWRIAARL
jgi:hypothetical protein